MLHPLLSSKDLSRDQFKEAARQATHALQDPMTGREPQSVVQSVLQDMGVSVPLSRLRS